MATSRTNVPSSKKLARKVAPARLLPGAGELAKLSRPRLYDALDRERLFLRIDQLRRHPVVWVSAPPGAGKTTLIASYLEARKQRGIWYQLDSGDSDVSTLFLYLNAASSALAPRKAALPLLTPEYLFELAGFARRYFREFLARLPKQAVLVLDNFQEIAKDSLFHQVMLAAFSEIPDGRNIIVISRAEPNADYTRGIANSEIAQLNWADIRLTFEETRAISNSRQRLSDAAVQGLHESSDGWAAGLVLMLERADTESKESKRIGLASREAVFDYFASIFFDHASLDDQRALLLLALVPTLSVSAATAIADDLRAAQLLEDLYRRQLFVQRLHGNKPTFRFHSLFREFLEAKAVAILSPQDLDAGRLRAAKVMVAHGEYDQAFRLYVTCEQWPAAANIVLPNAERMFAEGRWKTLIDWIGQLPSEMAQSDPWLAYWLGVSQFQVDQEISRTTLSHAFETFERAGNELGQMLTAASILIGFYFEYKNWEPAEAWIFRLGKLLDKEPEFPSRELELTVYSAMLYGIAIRRPDHSMLPVCIERTVALIEQPLESNTRMLGGLAITGPVCCMLGAFDLFHRVRKALIPLLENERLTELNRAAWHMTNGAKLCMNGDYEITYIELEQGALLGAQFNLRQVAFLSHFFISLHATCYFELERSRQGMEAMRRVVNSSHPLERTHQLWCEGLYDAAAGRFTPAIEKLKLGLKFAESIGSPAHRLVALVLLSAPLILGGQIAEAEVLAEEGLRFARERKVPTWNACFVFVLSWVNYERGDLKAAQQLLEQAIDVGEDGSHHYFRWLLQGCRKMFAFALRNGIRTDAIVDMVRHFRYGSPDPHLESWPWSVKIRTLGSFAIEVEGKPLRFGRKTPKRLLSLLQYLIAQGGRDIAQHKITDAMWPDADGDEAHGRLNLSLHRLRQLLGDAEAIKFSGGKVSLNPERVWVDALIMMNSHDAADSSEFRTIAMSVYRGEFLENELEEPWLLQIRNRLRLLHAEAIQNPPISTESEMKKKATSL